MREENIQRLSTTNIGPNDQHYLAYQTYHKPLFESFRKYAKGSLVDIGCGNKPYKSILDPYISGYTGVDIVQSSDNVVDVISPATSIPLENGTFDTVISTQTIEHVAEHQLLVNEAFRLLKPGGHFILSGPMYWPLHEEPYDFFRFTKHGFRHVLELAGFRVVEELANGGKWALCGQAIIHTVYKDLYVHKEWRWKFIRLLFRFVGGLEGFNKYFQKMDEDYYDEYNTMNYVFIATKDPA